MAEMPVLQGIKNNTDKIGVLTGLKTTNKTSLVGAVNENTEQINVLNDSRGYRNTKILPSDVDTNTIWQNGIYEINTNIAKNVPKIYGVAYLIVNGTNELFFTQKIIYLGGWEYSRSRINDSVLPWQQIATTTKTSFSVTPETGFSVSYNQSSIINNSIDVNVVINKTDNSALGVGQIKVATLPSSYSKNQACLNAIASAGGIYTTPISSFVYNSGLYVVINDATLKQVMINGGYTL